MARYGVTLTVQAGKMPSSQSNFAWLATADNFPAAAIDGGTTSILNGGGNLRCYTDSTKATQIPVEVVTFVTGVTPDIQVWGLSPTLNVASTVYIEADTVATIQPAVGATFGRNAVWTNNVATYHGNSLTDSSGNNDLTSYNSPVVGAAGRIGGAFDFTSSSSQYMDSSSISGVIGDDITLVSWVKPKTDTNSGQGVLSLRSDPANVSSAMWQRLTVQDNAGSNAVRGQYSREGGNSTLSDTIPASVGAWSMVATVMSGASSVSTYVNGSNKVTSTGGAITSNASHLYIGAWQASSPSILQYANMLIESSMYIVGEKSDDFITSIYNSQSDTSSFWSTGAWEDQDAGGGVTVTVTEILKSFVDVSNVSVDYNVSLLVTESFKQFTDSSAVSIESAESVILSVTESFNKFIDSSSVNTSKQVSLAVTEILKSFEDGANISIAKDVSVQVTEIMASFTDNSSVRLPANWNNKPVAVTSYTVKTPTTTIWIDKG